MKLPFKQLPIILTLLFLLAATATPQRTQLDKPLNDGTGAVALQVGKYFEGTDASLGKQKAIEPFVMGLFGFKALRTTNIAVGKLESMHLNICRIMLGLYDNEIDAHLQSLIDKGAGSPDFYFPTEAEIAVVQKFVVRKHSARYMGFTADFKPLPVDKVAAWKFFVGSALGEIAADVMGWYKFKNNAGYNKDVQDKLRNLSNDIQKAPANVAPQFILELKGLQALSSITKFTRSEQETIAASLGRTLAAAKQLADTATNELPKPQPSAVETYAVTNTMMGKNSQLVLRLTRSATGFSAEMTDSGGKRTLKFDSFVIKNDGTYSFTLTHKNGAVWVGTGKFAPDRSSLSGKVLYKIGNGQLHSTWNGKKQ